MLVSGAAQSELAVCILIFPPSWTSLWPPPPHPLFFFVLFLFPFLFYSRSCSRDSAQNLLTQTLDQIGGFPSGSLVMNLPSNAGDATTLGVGRCSGEGNINPTPEFLPGKSHRWRSLTGYIVSPLGRKELDTTEVTKQRRRNTTKAGGPRQSRHFVATSP